MEENAHCAISSVPGCSAKLNPRKVTKHLNKVHGKLQQVALEPSAIRKVEEVQPDGKVEPVQRLVPCPVSGCTAKLNPNRVERHMKRAHRTSFQPKVTSAQSSFAGTHLKIRVLKRSKRSMSSSSKYVVAKPVSQSHSKVSSYGQMPEKNLDATKGYAHAYRENGRFGSHPSHDGFDGESGPD